MKYIKRKNLQYNGDENVFWVTMSDLLLALVVVFLILFVFAITGFTQHKIQEQEAQYQTTEKIAQELKKNGIDVDVDKFSGTIKISDLQLFALNSAELTPNGKKYLSKFVPIYFNSIMKDKNIKNKISKIIIQGHTDSQPHAEAKSDEEKYYKNMDLSIRRAAAVAEYIVYANYKDKKDYDKELYKILTIEGKGSSEPILINGKEDYDKSRRVELKLTFKDKNILNTLKNNIP